MNHKKCIQLACFICLLFRDYQRHVTSGTPFLAVLISHTQAQNKLLLPSQFRHDFLDQYLLNISKTEHAIGQASSARHFPLVISMTSPLLFPLLAIFSEHFTTQILNTKVKKSPFLLQSYCNPSSHAEISNLGWFFFLWIILYTYDSRNTLKYLFLSLI